MKYALLFLFCFCAYTMATLVTPVSFSDFKANRVVEGDRYATAAEIAVEGDEVVFTVVCSQPRSSVQAQATLRDRDVYMDDCVEIYIDSEGRGKDYMQYIINSLGTLQDLRFRARRWNSAAKTEGIAGDSEWKVSLRVPLHEIASAAEVEDGDVCIKVNICRSVPGRRYHESLLEGGVFSQPKQFIKVRLKGITPEKLRSAFLEMLKSKDIDTAEIEKLTAVEFYKKGRELEKSTLESRYKLLPEGVKYVFETETNAIPNPRFEYVNFREEPANWIRNGQGTASGGKDGLTLKSAAKIELWQETQPLLDNTREYAVRAKVRSVSGKNHFVVRFAGVNPVIKQLGVEKMLDGISGPDFENNGKWTDVEFVFKVPRAAFRGEVGFSVENGELQVKSVELDLLGKEYSEIIVSQMGYHSDGYKDAIFWTRKEGLSPEFELLQGQRSVFRGKAVRFPGRPYGRETYVADFSRFRGEGKFRLKTNGMISREFKIGKKAYLDGMRFLLNGFYYQRQGFAQPGWKDKPDYMDDAVIVDEKARGKSKLLYTADGKLNPKIILGRRDVSGGWRDAGDPSKQGMDGSCIYSLARVLYHLNPDWNINKAELPDLADELWWGCSRWVRKCHMGDGTFVGETVNDTHNGPWIRRAPDKCTDGVVGTRDDRIVFAAATEDGKYRGWVGNQWVHHHSIGMTAIAMKKYDPSITAECIAVMEKYYLKLLERYEAWKLDDKKRWERYDLGRCAGKILYSAIYLHQLTGKEEYKAMADKMVQRIADMAINLDYPKFDMHSTLSKTIHYFNSMLEYAEFYPESEILPLVKKGITVYTDNMILPGYDEKELFPMFSERRLHARYGKTSRSKGIVAPSTLAAHTMLRAGRILKNRDYTIMAEKTLQFWVGRNPQNISEISGLGWRNAALMTGLSGCKGHEDGIVPGIMANGFRYLDFMPFPAKATEINPGGTIATKYGSEAWIHPTGLLFALIGDLEKGYSGRN